MLSKLFFGEESIYEAICREDSTAEKLLAHEIAEASRIVQDSLTEEGRRAWDTLREKESDQDAHRLYKAFLEGIRLSLRLTLTLVCDGESK